MSDERLNQAREFVRAAVSHFDQTISDAEIEMAAQKAAKALPPFKPIRRRSVKPGEQCDALQCSDANCPGDHSWP